MIKNIQILIHQGKQYIPDVREVEVPGIFRGRPIISDAAIDVQALVDLCPTNAINADPVCIDLGKCVFCEECAFAFPGKIKFTKDYKLATNYRDGLLIKEGEGKPIELNAEIIRKEIS